MELPGNARQIENLVRRAIAQKDDETPLGLEDLPREVLQSLVGPTIDPVLTVESGKQTTSARQGSPEMMSTLQSLFAKHRGNLSQALEQCERVLLQMTLEQVHGNQSQLAQLLGITPRSVYTKLRKYGLHPSR